MTTILDTKFLPKVYAAINKYGISATFTVQSSNTYDPTTGAAVLTTTTVVVKATPPAAYDRKLVDGSLIRVSDAYTIIAGQGLSFPPVQGQLVTIAGNAWTVLVVTPLISGDSVAAYQLQLRQ
jgi:hypothetical protein